MKKCTGQSHNMSLRKGYLKHRLVWWTRWKNNKNNALSWSSLEAKFLGQGFEVAQESDLRITTLAKNVGMLAAMSFFHPCSKLYIEEVLAIV